MAQHLILRRFGGTEEAARLVELFTKLYSRGSPLDEYRHLPGIARIVAAVSSLLFSIHLFTLVTSGMLEFLIRHGLSHGIPLRAKLLQSTSVLGAVLTLAVLLLTAVAWRRRYYTLWGRWHYSLVALISVAWLVLLYHWSLLVLIL